MAYQLKNIKVFLTVAVMLLILSASCYTYSAKPNPTISINKEENTIRSIAEFEQVKELIIVWPKWWDFGLEGLKASKQIPYFINITREAEKAVTVNIIVNSEIIKNKVISQLEENDIPLDNITFTKLFTNTIWLGDYGPFFIEKNGQLEIADFSCWSFFFRFFDDIFNYRFGQKYNIKCNLLGNFLFTIEGGNYLTNGEGIAIITDQIFDVNPKLSEEQIKKRMKYFLGLEEIIILEKETVPGTKHVDMFSKIISNDTIIVGKYNDTINENYQILERNVKVLENHSFNIIRIPMAVDPSFDENLSLTYTNAYIVNGTNKKIVFVPQYGIPKDDEAIVVYQNAMPDYEIIRFYSRGFDIIEGFGGIHCVTKTIPII